VADFERVTPPAEGQKIASADGRLLVPDDPIIPCIEGDGTGPDIWRAARPVLEAAVAKAYGGKRRLVWFPVYAGRAALERYGQDCVLPEDTVRVIEEYVVAIKGPLTTPVGGYAYVCLECAEEQDGVGGARPERCLKCGSQFVAKRFRSLNVTLRQRLELYACVRPVRYFEGVPSPVCRPQDLDVVIFRENTEDVYAGIEWAQGSPEALRLIQFLRDQFGVNVREDSGLGVKPISITATKRLVRKAIRYALEEGRKSVTLVHKGNIMKFTEGAFRDWGYEVATQEFRSQIVTEKEVQDQHGGKVPEGKLLIKDRIADNMFQQVLTRPSEYGVIALPNLNGDYLSDACAAQVGGLGLAPGANMGDALALFEATHGTAPKYAGQDKVNPSSLMLSGALMLDYLGWREAGELVREGIARAIKRRLVTYDLARLMGDLQPIRTSEFASAVIAHMP
jgi:isocitrate dehydrogenase